MIRKHFNTTCQYLVYESLRRRARGVEVLVSLPSPNFVIRFYKKLARRGSVSRTLSALHTVFFSFPIYGRGRKQQDSARFRAFEIRFDGAGRLACFVINRRQNVKVSS